MGNKKTLEDGLYSVKEVLKIQNELKYIVCWYILFGGKKRPIEKDDAKYYTDLQCYVEYYEYDLDEYNTIGKYNITIVG